ncbi:Rad4 beta-hairpin domain 3-domain-containing protein [Neocallimastix sp. 'constans']
MEDSNKLKLKSKSKSRKNSRLRKKSNNNNEEVVVEEKKEKKKGKKNNKSRKTSDDDDDDDEVKEKKKKLNNKNKNKNKEIDETDETNKTDENDEENETEEDSDKNKFLIKRYKDLEFLLGNPIFIERFVNTRNLYIILFVALARTAGYRCNFVASLHPIPLSFAKKKTNNHEAIELWTEIYCKRAKRWVPVNPLNKHSVYPIPKQLITNEFNEISYIITIDKDGFIKERTKRYARDFLTFTRKLRLKNDAKWWEVNVIKRYFTTNVIDDFDEEIPDETEEKQPLPTSISGFLNHPLYVLERHIKKYEVLYSKEPVLGYIRNEAIYPRSNVRPVNTKEYWIRQGLSIKEGAKAPKYVKSKVYTIRKKRMIEFSKQNAVLDKDFKLGDEMVPLYGDWQTEPYKAPPVKNGIVPKSQFGNIDMFKPSMLPEGGTHLQIQGLGPLARKLNIDFANAVVGFDFKLGHCVPIIDGIVVATENVDLLLSKFEEFELEKFKKFMKKKEKRIMSNWRRLVKGLISRERLIEKYGNEK